jgi:hypothetical protein
MEAFKTRAARRPSSNQPNPSTATPHLNQATGIDDFSARRSGRAINGQCVADNDTWVEALAVCEVANDPKKAKTTSKGPGLLKKLKSKSSMNSNDHSDSTNMQQQHEAQMALAAQRLTLRPYFQSQNTGQRVWDEPPSGASNIVYATAESRKMAHAQLEEMRATYAEASLIRKSEREEAAALERSFSERSGSIRKLSLPKIFKRSSSSMSETEVRTMKAPLVASNTVSAKTGIPESVLEESIGLATENAFEKDLQMAMMLSIGVGQGSVMGVGNNHSYRFIEGTGYSSEFASANNCTPAAAARREKEQIEMVKKLSLAEQKARNAPVDDCRKKSHKSKKKHAPSQYASLKSDESEIESRHVSKRAEKAAAAPTIDQINSDFNIDQSKYAGGKSEY